MKLLTAFTALLWSLPLIKASNVHLTKSCFVTGRPFTVTFSIDNPLEGDWVGIFPASQSTSTLSRVSASWAFGCGTMSCQTATASGSLSIRSNVSPGLYKAVLARDNNGGTKFQALAVSQTVRVVTSQDACFVQSPVSGPIATSPPSSVSKGAAKDGSDPTPAPNSGFPNSIFTDKTTYTFNQAVQVSFTSAQPKADDFVAIFPAVTSNNNLQTGSLWLFTCNRQGANPCSSPISQGSVTFGPSGPSATWGQGWPLVGGQYVAYLLRNSFRGPFTVVAQSGVFTVKSGSAPGSIGAARAALTQARAVIANMIFQNNVLTPKFLRMGFHDCVGGCDGCIDLTNPDNNGLEFPINVLAPVVQQFATNETGLSRADVWALAATVAVDVADHGVVTQPVAFGMNWFGRVDCEKANKVCRNSKGVAVPCSAKRGPHRSPPGVNLNSKGIMSYFAENFNFTQRQTVVAMGAHTVGSMNRSESGIDGPNGWTVNNRKVHNEYYDALVGSASATSTDQQKFSGSPAWRRVFLNNSLLSSHPPDRHFWKLNISGKLVTMTNADISLIRDLNPSNMDPVTGKVTCAFRPGIESPGVPVCPLLQSTYTTVATFKVNNDLWLKEFRSVLELVLTNGYKLVTCSTPVCRLVRK